MPGSGRELFHAAHYNMLAKRIRELRHESTPLHESALSDGDVAVHKMLDTLVKRLAAWFEEDNPRFERERWYEATDTADQEDDY